MLQRTLASLVLFTLLFTQAVHGLCQLRCDHRASSQTSPCHSMAMPGEQPSIHAEAPCPSSSCPSPPATAQAIQPDRTPHSTDQLFATANYPGQPQIASTIDFYPGLTRVDRRTPLPLPRLTSLRL